MAHVLEGRREQRPPNPLTAAVGMNELGPERAARRRLDAGETNQSLGGRVTLRRGRRRGRVALGRHEHPIGKAGERRLH